MSALSSSGTTAPRAPGHGDDVLVVGGGIAGLFCALKLAPRPVTVLAAAPLGGGGSSWWAQGGMAAAVGAGDTPAAHLADTVAAGAGTVDAAVAALMTAEAAARIDDLVGFGVPFDRDAEGRLAVGREAAHSQRRIVHVRGDRAGLEIMTALTGRARATPSIRLLESVSAESLVVEDGVVVGVIARAEEGRAATTIALAGRAVVLASGGVGHLWRVTTNPPQADGRGLAMAARAGAVVADPEFVQFHPTAIDVGRDPAPLATEALRGEGAILVDRHGRRFMADYDAALELAPRDVVARAIHAERAAGRGAFLDARAAIGAAFPERFPTVFEICRSAGIDPRVAPIPVAPAEHYHMGGVATDADGRTSLEGLWACGEVASTGVHGANRLASNSLLEAVVFADRIARDVAGRPARRIDGAGRRLAAATTVPPLPGDAAVVERVRDLMAADVGVVRDGAGLTRAVETLETLERAARSTRLGDVLLAARLIATAALLRRESRGGHFRSDHPTADPTWARRTFLTLDEAGTIRPLVRTEAPVP